jgi:hypothetical protein
MNPLLAVLCRPAAGIRCGLAACLAVASLGGLLQPTAAQPPLTIPAEEFLPVEEPAPALAPAAVPAITPTPFNVHLIVAEEFLNCFVARSDVKPGEVDDVIMGAKVDGQQWTETRLRLDLRPSPDRMHALFVLEGHVQSQTVGRTDQGAVQTLGRQHFYALKDVFFDGQQFSTRHAGVHVRAQNVPVGASTPLDGTLFQGLGTRMALRMAERQRPQSEEIARNRIVEKLYPTFDREIDQQLADLNERLEQQVRGSMRQVNLLPTTQLARSNETHLHYAARFALPDSGPQPPIPTQPLSQPHGATVYLHECLLNGLLDRLRLNGRKVTDRELRNIGAEVRRSLGGLPFDAGTPALPVETEIEFDAEQPLAVRFTGSRMELELRATFRPAGQALLPELSITVPVQLQRQPNDDWRLVYGDIVIRSVTGEDLPVVAQNLIRQSLQADLPSISFPSRFDIPAWPENLPRLKLSELQAGDGWLIVGIDATGDGGGSPQPLAQPQPVFPPEPLPGIAVPIRGRRR